MKINKLIPVVIVIISLFFLGCVKPPAPTPTATPTATGTMQPVFPTQSPTPALTASPAPSLEPIMYRVWVDSDFGFYRARAIRGNSSYDLPLGFDKLNFTIHAGDSVRWINDDSYDFPLTVVSNEGLWSGRTGLMRYQTERFDYTFNRTGTYTFSIREFQDLENQTITVIP
ncbi:MAG: hypothetical protein O8C62_09820 [Candidatus Methanoperedens sp.]|nr:hypothetical protein [Candidatus Methanoperedens sp.]